jgi:hypothetical protein
MVFSGLFADMLYKKLPSANPQKVNKVWVWNILRSQLLQVHFNLFVYFWTAILLVIC